MENNYSKRIKSILLSSLVVWIATYAAASRDIYMDLTSHTKWAFCLRPNNFFEFISEYVSYPLWHFSVRVFGKLFPLERLNTAAGVTALFNCFALWSIIYVWNRLSNVKLEFENISFFSVCLLFVGPLSLPAFNERYYLGQGSGNVWHNPTNIAVKGFAVLSFCVIIYILESIKTEKELWFSYLVLSGLLFLSALAKPSFMQGIIPGLGMYFIVALFINGFKGQIVRFLFIAISFVPATCVVGFQFVSSFLVENTVSNGTGIGIEFGRVLHRWSPNLGVSLLLAFAFPLAVLLINFKELIRRIPIQVALFYELAAWLESALLYEIGKRESHGNWLWGSYLSMFVVWMVFLINYLDVLNDGTTSSIRKKLNLCIGVPLLFLHLLFGISFWYNCSMFC